jgi:hypothetical protein
MFLKGTVAPVWVWLKVEQMDRAQLEEEPQITEYRIEIL